MRVCSHTRHTRIPSGTDARQSERTLLPQWGEGTDPSAIPAYPLPRLAYPETKASLKDAPQTTANRRQTLPVDLGAGHHGVEVDEADHAAIVGDDAVEQLGVDRVALGDVVDVVPWTPSGCRDTASTRMPTHLSPTDITTTTWFLVGEVWPSPKRARRSKIGTMVPRRLITPRTKSRVLGSGVGAVPGADLAHRGDLDAIGLLADREGDQLQAVGSPGAGAVGVVILECEGFHVLCLSGTGFLPASTAAHAALL